MSNDQPKELHSSGEPRSGISDFSWYSLDLIYSLNLSFPESDQDPTLVIRAQYRSPEGDAVVLLTFLGVRDLKIPVLSHGGFSFGEFTLKEVSDSQMEGIRFYLCDHLSGLSFYCFDYRAEKSPDGSDLETARPSDQASI